MVIVGAGGAAGTTGGSAPTAGGTSSFGPFVSATGGGLNYLATTSSPQNGATPPGIGTRIVLWLSGGQAGTVYTLTFSITTASGRAIQRSVLLPVLLLSIPKIDSDALLTSAGVMVIDQSGNLILLGNL